MVIWDAISPIMTSLLCSSPEGFMGVTHVYINMVRFSLICLQGYFCFSGNSPEHFNLNSSETPYVITYSHASPWIPAHTQMFLNKIAIWDAASGVWYSEGAAHMNSENGCTVWPDTIKQFEYGGYIGSIQVPIYVISHDKSLMIVL